MLSTVFLVYSLMVVVISFAWCIWLGYRRGVFNSAMRLGFFLLSGIVAFILAKLLIAPIGKALSDSLITTLSEDIAVFMSMSSLQQLVIKLGGGLLAPIVFMLLFFVIDKLTFIAYIPLKKKFADKEKLHTIPHDKLFGALLGGVLAFCITLTCVMPVGGYPSFLAETIDRISATTLAKELPTDMTETVDSVAGLSVVKIDYALSDWLFCGLTTDARTVVSSSLSLLDFVDSLQNAKDVITVSAALQALPKETIDLLVDVAKDAVMQLIPENVKAPYEKVVDVFLQALDELPALQEKLSSEEYAKEIQAVATITTMISNPSTVTNKEIIKVIISSSLLTNAVVDNSELLKNDLSEVTSELSKNEIKEIKDTVTQYANEMDVNDEAVSSILSIFGIS